MVNVKFEGSYTTTGKYSIVYKCEVNADDTDDMIETAYKKAVGLFTKIDKFAETQKIRKS